MWEDEEGGKEEGRELREMFGQTSHETTCTTGRQTFRGAVASEYLIPCRNFSYLMCV